MRMCFVHIGANMQHWRLSNTQSRMCRFIDCRKVSVYWKYSTDTIVFYVHTADAMPNAGCVFC